MVVGAGKIQVPIIEECKKLGHYVIVTDINLNAPGMKLADATYNIDTQDNKATLEVAKKNKINGIVTTSDYPVRTVAYVNENLGLQGLSQKSAIISTNKFLLRETLSANNISCPKYWIINDSSDIDTVFKKITYPVIVKPVDSSASRGVSKVNNFNELVNALNLAKTYSKKGDVLIEEYLVGPEYSVESLTQNGSTTIVAITEKTTDNSDRYFVEVRHLIPAQINNIDKEKIEALVKKTIKSIGLDNSASHTELKLTKDGPIIIEIGARLGGDYITSDLVPLSTGVNMLDNAINICLGQSLKTKATKNRYAGVQFIDSDNYEKINKYLNKLQAEDEFVRSELGEYKVGELRSSLDRLGYYICASDSREKLIKALRYSS